MKILSPQSIIEVHQWYNKKSFSKSKITKGYPVIGISFDVASFGWGVVCNNFGTGGAISLNEME